ncbi:MAG: SOS response-associated peptidase, partial [Syntrophaceae bacterium]|nr:SOS response-associated peptidase [Syntrophaceae bacterium]
CDYAPPHEVYPGRDVYAVVRKKANQLVTFHWGLVPAWSKEPATGKKLINARAETLAQKPSFRSIFKRQRCLVVADGFYEWEKTAGKRIPHYYQLASGHPFGFAGLYDGHIRDGKMMRTCTIITTTPNDLIRAIHDRMPVIVSKGEEAIWLDPAVSDPERLLSMLRPYPPEAMVHHKGVFPSNGPPMSR